MTLDTRSKCRPDVNQGYWAQRWSRSNESSAARRHQSKQTREVEAGHVLLRPCGPWAWNLLLHHTRWVMTQNLISDTQSSRHELPHWVWFWQNWNFSPSMALSVSNQCGMHQSVGSKVFEVLTEGSWRKICAPTRKFHVMSCLIGHCVDQSELQGSVEFDKSSFHLVGNPALGKFRDNSDCWG